MRSQNGPGKYLVKEEPLEAVDWRKEVGLPANHDHPINIIMRKNVIYENLNGTPGRVIAYTSPGYEFRYAHKHIHIVKEGTPYDY